MNFVKNNTTTVVCQRLLRLSDACGGLHQKINCCLRRLTVLGTPLGHEDVASIHDRMNELFTSFAVLTRSHAWHELDVDEEIHR